MFDGVDWSLDTSRDLARQLLRDVQDRWAHVSGVARAAEELAGGTCLISAAWLHDVGYGPEAVLTGMHAIDGAMYLDLHGAPQSLVSLVAYHSGAEFEAGERGLLDQLLLFDPPSQDDLDLLTLADMTTGRAGERVTVERRLADIFERYEPENPVHRAVTRSQDYLVECCRRASKATGYPM